MWKRALLAWALLSGCALSSGAEPPSDAADDANAADAEQDVTSAIPAEGSSGARAMLRFVQRSDAAALRAIHVSAAKATALAAHRSAVYLLADLTALGASRTDLGRIARAATKSAPVDEACAATTPRSLPSELIVTPDEGDTRVVALIAGATTSIDIVMYELSEHAVRTALASASARGVHVRVILDRTRPGTPGMLTELHGEKIEAQASSQRFAFTHEKTMVVDSRTLLVFSGNFDNASFATGRNFGVVLGDAEDVWDVEDLFAADWADREPDLACTRLVVAPVNARDRVVALIDSAVSDLVVEALYASDPAVTGAIIGAKNRGVAVRVLFNDPKFGVGDASNEAHLLAGQGIPVRRSPALFIHAKLIVADHHAVFIGSENFSANSVLRNREVGVVVTSADVDVARIVSVFEHDFAAGAAFSAQ